MRPAAPKGLTYSKTAKKAIKYLNAEIKGDEDFTTYGRRNRVFCFNAPAFEATW